MSFRPSTSPVVRPSSDTVVSTVVGVSPSQVHPSDPSGGVDTAVVSGYSAVSRHGVTSSRVDPEAVEGPVSDSVSQTGFRSLSGRVPSTVTSVLVTRFVDTPSCVVGPVCHRGVTVGTVTTSPTLMRHQPSRVPRVPAVCVRDVEVSGSGPDTSRAGRRPVVPPGRRLPS